jgi:hypothetical protein
MVLKLFAVSVLLLASTISATYQGGPWLSAHATYYGPDNGQDNFMGKLCSC